MAGFGSFMEGLQGGISSMQDIRRKRQLDEIYDQEITLGREKVSGRDLSRSRAGLPALKKFSSGDPFLFRLMEKLGRGTGTTESPTANALPTSGETDTPPISLSGDYSVEMPELDPTQFEAPDYEFAGGTPGSVEEAMRRADELALEEDTGPKKRQGYSADSEAEIQKRASRARTASAPAREAIPTQVIDRSGDKTLGQKVAAKAKAAAKYEGVGMPSKAGAGLLRRGAGALGRAAAIGGIVGAGAGGIRGALETETTGDGFWSDVGQRAVGAGKGVVAGVLDPIGAIMGSDEAAPEAAPEAIPTGSSGPTRRYSRRNPSAPAAGPGASAAAPTAVPETAAPAEANPLANFDISKVSAEQIPNFSNKDWESFREENIQELVANGMSYAEAWDKVDQQTIATQRRGFLHFASQADALLKHGDKRGAAAAVRAAFQYMPSTTDLKVGEYNGHVVAFGVDEETGEQVGSPMVITPDLLQQVQMNFANPQVWAEYAQDRRKLDQADRELGQGDRRLDLVEQGVGIERENALTRRIDAIGGIPGQGGSSLKESDIATARRSIDDWAFGVGQTEGADPALGSALKALAEAEYKRRGGDLNTITLRLEEVLKASGEAAIIAAARRLASGQ